MMPFANMRSLCKGLLVLGLLLLSPLGQAQSTRTWVSGVGNDANPCSRTAPCATLAGAFAKTAAGGEIDVLDTGAFDYLVNAATYVPLVINKPITINGGAGQVAGLGPMSSTDALTQSAALIINLPPGTQGSVTLRNLSLNGFGGIGSDGIRLMSPTNLVVSGLQVANFAQNCLRVDAGASGALIDISDSTFLNCGTGVMNAATASINIGDSLIALNSGIGVNSATKQGPVWLFNTHAMGNTGNVNLGNYSGGASAIAGGITGCDFASQQFVAPTSLEAGLPAGASPGAAAFQFITTPCGAGATVTITLTYAQAFAPGTKLLRYGPATPGAATSTWFAVPGASLSVDRTTFTYTVTDNGIGDADSTPGIIKDPVLPVSPESTPVPTTSKGMLVLLAGLLMAASLPWLAKRRRVL